MDRVQFQIGKEQHIRVNLPSKEPGNNDVFMGRAILKASRLSCSQDVKFSRKELKLLLKQIKTVYKTLEGTFTLESSGHRFKLKGTVNQKRMINTEVTTNSILFTQPDNVEWSASASFTCYPEDLQDAISALNNID